MTLWTYRFVVVGSLFSSALAGSHVPALHNMIDHGATARWDVIGATSVLVVSALAGAWVLLRIPSPSNGRLRQ